MRLQQFQVMLIEKIRPQLARPLRNFRVSSFFTLVKVFYARPKIHYEVWVRGKERLIEIGLHCEADKTTNDALRAYFESRAIEILAALGPRIEIEQWTNSWSRVHEVAPYTTLDAALVETVAQKLARMINTLEPMLNEYSGQSKRKRNSK